MVEIFDKFRAAVRQIDGSDESRHRRRPGKHNENTSRDCGVCKVFAKTAEKHLHDKRRENSADNRHVNRNGRREIEPQKYARYDRRQIVDGVRFFPDKVVNIFPEIRARDANRRHEQSVQSVQQKRRYYRGHKRDYYVKHNAPCRSAVRDVRRSRNYVFITAVVHIKSSSPLWFSCQDGLPE